MPRPPLAHRPVVLAAAIALAAVPASALACPAPLEGAATADGFCAQVFAGGLLEVRGLAIDSDGIVLAVERGRARIISLSDADGDLTAEVETVVTQSGLNHGLAIHGGYLYASSSSTVYRWAYSGGKVSPRRKHSTTPAHSGMTRPLVVVPCIPPRSTPAPATASAQPPTGAGPYQSPRPYNTASLPLSPPKLQATSSAGGVIKNMAADGRGGAPLGHTTRTVAVDPSGLHLYVSIGSAGNIDIDSYRSRIRRFDLSVPVPDGGHDFATGEVFADGLRNEVALSFDSRGRLWGVGNSADRLISGTLPRSDLGGDIHNDNPAEDLHVFDGPSGTHFGYPWCWTEYSLPPGLGAGRGSRWAWPDTMSDGVHDDVWCREETTSPNLAMQAHSAPLGIRLFSGLERSGPGAVPDELRDRCAPADARCALHEHAMASDITTLSEACPPMLSIATVLHPNCVPPNPHPPCTMRPTPRAYVAFHGSWNRDSPTGYKLVSVALEEGSGLPVAGHPGPSDVLWSANPGDARWTNGFRPVDVIVDAQGRLLVSSDGTRGVGGGMVVMMMWQGSIPTLNPSPAPVPVRVSPVPSPAPLPVRTPSLSPTPGMPPAPGPAFVPIPPASAAASPLLPGLPPFYSGSSGPNPSPEPSQGPEPAPGPGQPVMPPAP
eukprot:gene4105-748_t